jgi:hypothetical protein
MSLLFPIQLRKTTIIIFIRISKLVGYSWNEYKSVQIRHEECNDQLEDKADAYFSAKKNIVVNQQYEMKGRETLRGYPTGVGGA